MLEDAVLRYGLIPGAGLNADLNMIQSGFLELDNSFFGQAVARRNQVGIITQVPGMFNQLGQVFTGEGFAPEKPNCTAPILRACVSTRFQSSVSSSA